MTSSALAREPATDTALHWPGSIGPDALAVTFVARVVGVDDSGDTYTLDAGGPPCRARRATSCLLEPRVGDRAACWRAADPGDGGGLYVVAILERVGTAAARVGVAGDLELVASGGTLRIGGGQAIEVRAPRLDVDVETLSARSKVASIVADAIEALAAACTATFGQIKAVGSSWTTVFDRETHHAGQHQRSVDGVDRLDAAVVDHEARVLMQLHGENVIANGTSLVKMRSAQIHLG